VKTAPLDYLEHDPGKWTPIFGKEHASARRLIMMAIQLNVIMI